MLAVALTASAKIYLRDHKKIEPSVASVRSAYIQSPKSSGPVAAKKSDGLLIRAQYEESSSDPFSVRSWNDPPPPVVAPPAPPIVVPTAPPLPFRYLGKTEIVGEVNSARIHILRDGVVYSVQAGEKIDDNYQISSITEEGVVFDYLPLAFKQTLPIGSK